MISLKVGDLKPALAGLAKVVSIKSAFEPLRCVRVDAEPGNVTMAASDTDMYAKAELAGAACDAAESFLLPLDRLQSVARRLPANALVYLEPGRIACDLGGGRASESVASPKLEDFPQEPAFETAAVPLPDTFARRFAEAMGCASQDATRYVLGGVQLDVGESGHYVVGTDGKHLFSANSFELPLAESAIVPRHKLLQWRGLAEVPWAMAAQKKEDRTVVCIVAGAWTLTFKALDGNYPNWRQVVPQHHRTTVTLPENHEFGKIVLGLPAGSGKDTYVDLRVENGKVLVADAKGCTTIPLAGAATNGPDVKIRLNRDYLVKAFDYGLTKVGLIDAMSPLHFTREGRQLVVMPVRVVDEAPAQAPEEEEKPTARPEPQPEKKTMTATDGQNIKKATDAKPAAEKPAIENAIEKLDALKGSFRKTLADLAELAALLKQTVRDQKAGEKEIQQVRQTLRSLQGVRI